MMSTVDSLDVLSSASSLTNSVDQFWKAVAVWLERPNLVNRKLCGATFSVREHHIRLQENHSIISSLSWRNGLTVKLIKDLLVDESDLSVAMLNNMEGVLGVSDDQTEGLTVVISIRTLLPKIVTKYNNLMEFVVFCARTNEMLFLPVLSMEHGSWVPSSDQAYMIKFAGGTNERDMKEPKILILAETSKPHQHHSSHWLSDIFLPKLIKWSSKDILQTKSSTQRLVPIERYNQVYQEMKIKYGKKLIENWSENTDPYKFVYEEVGIASYLLVMFEEERKLKDCDKKQSFVDLGCGNGLLVYVLAEEGHRGLGIDVRKRSIWDSYGPKVKLKEAAITPSDETLFPEFDWLIGNHSDELTPWIPVIAARSGYHCNFFLLPCCPYDFNGKFNARQSGCSHYQSYLKYVKEIGVVCGFDVEQDILRIPSTKRTCFIGKSRTYAPTEEAIQAKESEISDFISHRCKDGHPKSDVKELPSQACRTTCTNPCSACEGNSSPSSEENMDLSSESQLSSSLEETTKAKQRRIEKNKNEPCQSGCGELASVDNCPDHSDMEYSTKVQSSSHTAVVHSCPWIKSFNPRCQVERTRNCTSVSKSLQNRIVNDVFKALLDASDAAVIVRDDGRRWNRGGILSLGEVAAMFESSVLSQLKNECGGLQTLLRNQHQIFLVAGGKVRLRYEGHGDLPQKRRKRVSKGDNKQYLKTKPCWFFENHPDGCPWRTDECKFAHGEEDKKIFR